MSDLGFNVWGAVAAVVGTAALIPVIHAWFNTHLPRALLPTLSSILQETQESFVTGLREGLFTDDTELYHFHNRIRAIKRQVGEARAEALEATSWRQDVRNWYTGLSSKISHLCRNIDDIRAKLARTQSNKRKLLEAQGYPDTLMISPYAQELLREYTQGTLLPSLSAISLPSVELTASASVVHRELANGTRTDSPSSHPQSSRTSTSFLFSYDSKYHLISDADLKDLLSLALSFVRSRQASDARDVPSVTAQDASLAGAPKPASTNGLYAQRRSKLAIRRAKRAGIKADWLYRPIIRRSLAAIGMPSAHLQPDPESLVPPGFGYCEQGF